MPGYNQSMKSNIIRRYRRKLRRVQLNFRRMNFTLIGDEGKPWRRAIAIAAGVLLLLVALIFGRAETQLMSSAEVKTVQERGVLRIGVIPDMPGVELEREQGRIPRRYHHDRRHQHRRRHGGYGDSTHGEPDVRKVHLFRQLLYRGMYISCKERHQRLCAQELYGGVYTIQQAEKDRGGYNP